MTSCFVNCRVPGKPRSTVQTEVKSEKSSPLPGGACPTSHRGREH